MLHSQFELLGTRRFLPLFITQFLGAFNDNLFKNALIILLTYRAAEQSGMDPRLLVTAAAAVFILPFFLFSATAGQLADKFEKSRLIRLTRLFEIPILLAGAAGLYIEDHRVLLTVLFLAGTNAAFFGPLKYSILPDHLKETELIGGNALVEAGTFIAILLGTLLGGLLILKDNGVCAVSALMVLIAIAGYLSSFKIPHTKPAQGALKINPNIVSETWNIVRHAATQKDSFLSIIGVSWFWLVGFTFLAQFPIYAKDVAGADETVVTLFLTVFSVGIAIGSLICNKLLKGEISGAYVPLGAGGMTAAIFLLWLISPAPAVHETLIGIAGFLALPVGWLILASLLAISVFGGIYIVPLYAIMQARCDAAHRSRTVAANNIMNALFMTLGALLTMLLLKMHMDISDIFLTLGVLNIPVALIVRNVVHKRIAARKAKENQK